MAATQERYLIKFDENGRSSFYQTYMTYVLLKDKNSLTNDRSEGENGAFQNYRRIFRSVTRLGGFEHVWQHVLAKVAKILCKFLGFCNNITFEVKTAVTPFSATFGQLFIPMFSHMLSDAFESLSNLYYLKNLKTDIRVVKRPLVITIK